MLKQYSIVSPFIALFIPALTFGQDWSDEQKHVMCKVTAGMALEATLRRDKGAAINDAKIELEKFFTTGQSSALMNSYIDVTLAYAYRLKDFNANTNYSIWYTSCTVQVIFQRRSSVEIKYDYISMVREKLLECEKSPGSDVRPNKCVINVMMPVLR